ncbi:zinc-ribbon like family protein [Nitzschia inconspicua]|uniref:Zinc-ribbon like family protein n=1 Tax=Nitzschia inconspicua TaxID=303405 RepID=A0A9K3PWW0_9STRA|nr:zinc-ribbon like family protein [Nitzschia inconspicua]
MSQREETTAESSSRGLASGTSTIISSSYPVAPYPPVMNVRANASPQKSALSSSPHYSTVYGGGAASALTASDVRGGGGGDSLARLENALTSSSGDMSMTSGTTSDADVYGQYSSMRMGSSVQQYNKSGSNISSSSSISNNNNNTMSSASSLTTSNLQGTTATTSLKSQITFCPGWHDVVAIINCAPSTTYIRPLPRIMSNGSNLLANQSSVIADGNQPSSRKLGPVMLELRKVEVAEAALRPKQSSHYESKLQQSSTSMGSGRGGGVLRLPSSLRNGNDYDNDETGLDGYEGMGNLDPKFFTTRTVGISRGNPSLGLSVASTCLAMSPVQNYDSVMAATGSTTGALCIHHFELDELDEIDITNASINGEVTRASFSASPIEYFHNSRHHRQATAVAWRPVKSSHVAVGLVGSTVSGSMPHAGHHHHHRRAGPGMRTSGDREFCCFLWDIIDNKKTTSPLQKLCHNTPVASMAWMMDGQTLVVGSHQRTVHLYDMRVEAGTNAPPLSAHVHESGVHGIEVDPHRPYLMATFCRGVGEPVKLFDIRRMEKAVSEIKITSSMSQESSSLLNPSHRTQQSKVEAIHWSMLEPGILSIAAGDFVQHYDTSSGARPVLVKVNHCRGGTIVKDLALYRGKNEKAFDEAASLGDMVSRKGSNESTQHEDDVATSATIVDVSDRLVRMLYPRRMLAVLGDRTIQDIPTDHVAPVAISRRDGRLVHALGPHLFMGAPDVGPAGMEKTTISTDEDDISAVMMKRARCIQASAYSMDPESNIKLLSAEISMEGRTTERLPSQSTKYSNRELIRLWSWIDRVEALSFQDVEDLDNENIWTAKGLLDAGTWHLLEIETSASGDSVESHVEVSLSETLGCNVYDSTSRRAALAANGWAGKYDLTIAMAECEALGEFERSAALAVWHENVGAAVVALQRGSQAMRSKAKECPNSSLDNIRYAETLDLVAMCIAGYGGKTAAQLAVWRTACTGLLQREDLSLEKSGQSGIAYLRGLCEFLLNVGTNESLSHVLDNPHLSLSDRVAFACRFLGNAKLAAYLRRCIEKCQREGIIEGLVITGLSKDGIKILQSFVDIYSDIQTTALVVSRVVFPPDWTHERRTCLEWVECYRSILNTWQMWQSRGMFDVDRAEVLRRFKARVNGATNYQRRMPANPRARQSPQPPDPDILPSNPAQMEVRCNYCSSPMSLKRNAGMTNQWLSKMQPLLNCCPQCRKPLPRCSICLLSLGALNPYMELTRQRQGTRAVGGKNSQTSDDLSSLSSMSFAEWYTWCMRCRHGGHAHHMLGWFANQKTCPVSGCNCECEFDGVKKLNRPAICLEVRNDGST